ncbi:adenylyltransferase/cytidyltransferase family protein [Patescibacteria group bacterium]
METQGNSEKIVMVFGTFDVFHAGHEHFLKQAKQLGDYLIATVARDLTVKNVKGQYPEQHERERLKKVRESGIADKVIHGYTDDKYRVIKKFKPNVIALGYDQFVFTYQLQKALIEEQMDTEIIRLDSYKPGIYKSTLIKVQNEEKEETY